MFIPLLLLYTKVCAPVHIFLSYGVISACITVFMMHFTFPRAIISAVLFNEPYLQAGQLMESETPIVFYYYPDLTDTEYFCREVEKRFRETGHSRKIDFRVWNCYNEKPGRDGDLFLYDCGVLSALCRDGFFRELPDIIDLHDVFDWARDNTLSDHRMVGIPVLGCCLAVICRTRDYEPFSNVFDIKGRISTHLKSLLINFYLMSLVNYQNNKDSFLEPLRRLKESMGPELCRKSSLSQSAVADAFIDGTCPYFIGFTESLKNFPKDEYTVHLANFSEEEANEFPMFMVDMVSMGRHVSEEKLLDCLDLMEIISSPDFACDLCTSGGELQYMLPVSRTALKRLASWDGIYNRFYEIMSNENNCVIRFSPDYYDTICDFEKEILRLIGLADV